MVKAGGVRLTSDEEDVVKPMSRMAMFRATNEAQAAHEDRVRQAGKKTVYRINGYDLGKTAFEYAKYLLGKTDLDAGGATKASDSATEPAPQDRPQDSQAAGEVDAGAAPHFRDLKSVQTPAGSLRAGAANNNPSVPGRMAIHSSAAFAVALQRGSTTTTFPPRSRIAAMRPGKSGAVQRLPFDSCGFAPSIRR